MNSYINLFQREILENENIRLIYLTEDPLFIAVDIAEYFESSGNIRRYCVACEKKQEESKDLPEYQQEVGKHLMPNSRNKNVLMWYFTENGLNKYIMSLRTPKANEFKTCMMEEYNAYQERTTGERGWMRLYKGHIEPHFDNEEDNLMILNRANEEKKDEQKSQYTSDDAKNNNITYIKYKAVSFPINEKNTTTNGMLTLMEFMRISERMKTIPPNTLSLFIKSCEYDDRKQWFTSDEVCQILGYENKNLTAALKKEFIEEIDYKILLLSTQQQNSEKDTEAQNLEYELQEQKTAEKRGGSNKNQFSISTNTVKELAIRKDRSVRRYYIVLEQLLKDYHNYQLVFSVWLFEFQIKTERKSYIDSLLKKDIETNKLLMEKDAATNKLLIEKDAATNKLLQIKDEEIKTLQIQTSNSGMIYKFYDNVTNTLLYVGKSKNFDDARIYQHFTERNNILNNHLLIDIKLATMKREDIGIIKSEIKYFSEDTLFQEEASQIINLMPSCNRTHNTEIYNCTTCNKKYKSFTAFQKHNNSHLNLAINDT